MSGRTLESSVPLLRHHLCSNISPNSSCTRCRPIASAFRPAGVARYTRRFPSRVQSRAGPKVTLSCHAVQDGIEGAGAQPIAMATKLVDHRLAEDRAFGGVMKDMQPDEAGVQVPIDHRCP